jgi:DNA-binding CsgD family transcriptional regulator
VCRGGEAVAVIRQRIRSDDPYPDLGQQMTWRLCWEHTSMLAEEAHGGADADMAEISGAGADQIVAGQAARCWPPEAARQREAIALRYYADLSEGEVAAAMGISRSAVKSHTARGMAALRAAIEQAPGRSPGLPVSGPTVADVKGLHCCPEQEGLSQQERHILET